MNTIVKRFVLPALIPFAFVACGKNSDGSTKTPADVLNNAKDSVDQAAQDGALQNKLFAAECNIEPVEALKSFFTTEGEVVIKSSLTQYEFLGNKITKATLLYPTTDCSDAALTFRETGKFDINAGNKTADGGKEINFTFDTLTLEANSDAGVKLADEGVLCDSGNWEKSKQRNVTGASAKANCYNEAMPHEVKEVYLVEGDVLLLGDRGFLSKDTNRPERLDRDNKLVKK